MSDAAGTVTQGWQYRRDTIVRLEEQDTHVEAMLVNPGEGFYSHGVCYMIVFNRLSFAVYAQNIGEAIDTFADFADNFAGEWFTVEEGSEEHTELDSIGVTGYAGNYC